MYVQWLLKAVVGVVVVFLLMLPYLCWASGGSVTVQWGDKKESQAPPPSKSKVEKKSPPDHAPAHGHRAKHQYRYYPDSQVYFDTNRNVYFYLDRGSWRMAASLPGSIRLSSGHVAIGMDSDRPYTHYQEHKAKYPPGQEKKKGKGKK